MQDEVNLARRAVHEPEAFSELYRRHVQRVYRYLYSRVGNVPDAEDLTAQTFLTALKSIRHYRGECAFAAWLLGIARHQFADYVRRNPRWAMLDENLPQGAPSPEAQVERRLQLEQIAHGLRGMSPDRAESLALRAFGGLTTAEIAGLMGKSEEAVHSLISRAMRDLREYVSEDKLPVVE